MRIFVLLCTIWKIKNVEKKCMSYQVLARKWRPKNFDQLVGQEHVLRALINALDSQRIHHAFLFSGTRGVGKTTTAVNLSAYFAASEIAGWHDQSIG